MDDAVTVTSPGELVALVPHLLGFRPAESMVCLAFGNAPVARVDLPTSESDIPDFVSALAEVYGRLSGTPMALVAFSEDPRRALQALGPLVDRLGQGRQLGPVLWVRAMSSPSSTRSLGDASTLKSRCDASFVAVGRPRTAPSSGPRTAGGHFAGPQQLAVRCPRPP